MDSYSWGESKIKKNKNVSAGQLTAGEVNDFSKWTLWTDSSSKILLQYESVWKIAPKHRFVVQVTDQRNLPLPDAKVELLDAAGYIIYSARTDNTGKAELWGSLDDSAKGDLKNMRISVEFQGVKKEVRKGKEFQEGINYMMFEVECQTYQKVDVAFVVDATGSMGDELDYLKAELNDVIFKSKEISTSLVFNFANVFYRDRSDSYLTLKQPFTRVLSEATMFIEAQNAQGGGDYPEAVEVALDTAINGLKWSEDAIARVLFIILDAPPHQGADINSKLNQLAKTAAKKGIRIVPIAASGTDKSTEYLMRCLALATNGTYTFLTNHSGIGNNHIEPTTDEYKVETLNDVLVRIMKSYSYMPDCQQIIPDLNLNYPDSQVVVNMPKLPQDSTKTTDSTVTIDSIPSESFSWKYYPNPTDGIVNITATKKIEELYISDLSGKVLQIVKNLDANMEVRIDLSTYATGIYLIRYPMENRWISGKIVLQR